MIKVNNLQGKNTVNLYSPISFDQNREKNHNYEEKLANPFLQQTHIELTCLKMTS